MKTYIKRAPYLFCVVIFLCVIVLSGCSGMRAPTNLSIDTLSDELIWEGVDGAESYIVSTGDKNYSTVECAFPLTALDAGTYTLKVKAVAGSKSSAWSEGITYVKEEDQPFELSLTAANSAYEITGAGLSSGDVVIPDEYGGLPIISIAKNAFANADITSVALGKNMRRIGEGAFKNCSSLAAVTFNDGLEEIGAYAFQGCTSLSAVQLSESLLSFGEYAFAYCSSLLSANIPVGVTVIPDGAFSDCRQLQEIDIANAKEVGKYAFSGCKALKKVDFGEAESIAEGAFYNCTALETISLSADIGDMAFMNCSSLSAVNMAGGNSIGAQAFYGCGALSSVELPQSLSGISEYAFENTALFAAAEGLVTVGDWVVGCTDKEQTELIVPDGIKGIADLALRELPSVRSVTFPDSLRYIGSWNFYSATSLEEVAWGKGVESIGEYAFSGCTSLNILSLPEGLKKVGKKAFSDTLNFALAEDLVIVGGWVLGTVEEDIANLEAPEGAVGIADNAFAGKANLTSLTLPQTLRYIGEYAFAQCGLNGVVIPEGVTEIRPYTFYKCTSLADVSLPDGVESIGRSAFYNASGLKEISLPSVLKSIGDYAFYRSGLESIVFGDDLERIGECAFYDNSSLVSVTFGRGLRSLGDYAFYKALALENVALYGVEEVGDYAFYGCTALSSVALDGVRQIGNYAFYKCPQLTCIDFGSDVKEIGDYAFTYCSALRELNLPEGLQSIGEYAFVGCTALTGVTLPASLINIGGYAFAAINGITFYTSLAKEEAPGGGWNVSFSPVLYGCIFTDGWLFSYTKSADTAENLSSLGTISPPLRNGFEFAGWALSPDGEVVYTIDKIAEIPDGMTVYAAWVEK